MKKIFTFFLIGLLFLNLACSSEPTITDAIEAESNAYAPIIDEEPLYMIDDTSFILNDTIFASSDEDTSEYPQK